MCVKPITLKNRERQTGRNEWTTAVPCGKCPECARAKCNAWLFRINKELERSIKPIFALITYDEKNVPKTEKGNVTLRKKDLQDWLKRLRKEYTKYSDNKIKYYIVGEYGTKKGRPHYHAIIMNLTMPELIQKTWGKGGCTTPPLRIGDKNEGVRYALKYISKPKGKITDKEREFAIMSKGIGENYLTPQIIKYHNQNINKSYLTTHDGYKIPIPKYYKEKIYDVEKRFLVTKYLQERAEESEKNAIKKIIHKDNRKNEEEAKKVLEINKMHSTFEKRNETL